MSRGRTGPYREKCDDVHGAFCIRGRLGPYRAGGGGCHGGTHVLRYIPFEQRYGTRLDWRSVMKDGSYPQPTSVQTRFGTISIASSRSLKPEFEVFVWHLRHPILCAPGGSFGKTRGNYLTCLSSCLPNVVCHPELGRLHRSPPCERFQFTSPIDSLFI
jgi:hypothetical protein